MADLTTYDYDIFLSHNHTDQEWTAKLAERLEQEDWQGRKLKVFFSPWDIRPGQSIPKEIENALPKSRKVGLIMSPNAVESAWVELERLVTTYIAVSARDERLIPLYRRPCDIPALLQPILSIDFRDDAEFEKGYRALVAVIRNDPLPRGSRSSVANVGNLSPQIPRPPVVGFVARRDSNGRDIVERLKRELAPHTNQLVALSGPGGVGKTTLAAEATRALSESFGLSVVWAGALGREDFALSTLLDTITTQLGHPEIRSLAPEQKGEQVQALIAAAPPLIILDNFETILEAEQGRCIEFLSNRASCPVLITTRQKIASARNITIPAMSTEEADDFLQRLIEQSIDPSAFAQLDRDRIMLASERNPLVIQWVMGQIDLAQDADAVLDELLQGVGDAAQRVFDRSFGLEQLGEDGRSALLTLSLFTPDASRAALAEVAGFEDDTKRLNEAVKRLAGLYLVKTALGGQRLTVAGLTLELTKARLSKNERANEFRKRFVAYFLRYVEAHTKPKPEDYDALEAEKGNLLRAVDVALSLDDWDSVQRISLPLVSPANGMLCVHGYWSEAILLGKQALEAAKNSSNEWYIGAFASGLGTMFAEQGNYSSAREYYNLAVEIARRLDAKQGLAATLHELGRLEEAQGEIERAKQLYEESLEIGRKLNDYGGIAASLYHLAILAHKQGGLSEARRLANESLEIEKKRGNQNGISTSLHQLAVFAQDQGKLVEARRLLNQSLEIKKAIGNQFGIAVSLGQLARIEEAEGTSVEAAQLYQEALVIFERLESPLAKDARMDFERVTAKL